MNQISDFIPREIWQRHWIIVHKPSRLILRGFYSSKQEATDRIDQLLERPDELDRLIWQTYEKRSVLNRSAVEAVISSNHLVERRAADLELFDVETKHD